MKNGPWSFHLGHGTTWYVVNLTVEGWNHKGPLLLTRISNYIYHKVLDVITYPFPIFNGEVWKWIINFFQHFTGPCDYISNAGATERALKVRVCMGFKQENSWTVRAVITPSPCSIKLSVIRIVKSSHNNDFTCSGTIFQWRHLRVMASQIIGNSTFCFFVVFLTECSSLEQQKRQNHFHVMPSS